MSKYADSIRYLSILLASMLMLSVSPVRAADCNKWKLQIIPFFWAVNINGDIEVGVPAEGIENQLLHISENWSGLLKHIHSGGMLDINAEKGRFGLFSNIMYVSIKNLEVTTSDGFEVAVNTKFGLVSVGALYSLYEQEFHCNRKLALAPYIGARYTKNDSSAVLIEAPEYSDSHHAHWTEPFIGAMFTFDFNQKWSINLAGDVGGFMKNQDSYNLFGLLGYEPRKCMTIYLGYRQFYQSFMQGAGASFFEWKMHISGPIVGVAFNF